MTAKATSPREPDGTNTKTGSGEHTTQRASGTGEDFDKKLVAYKQRMKAHTDAIKRHLTHFIDKTTHPADGSPVTTALLELGFERHLDLHGEEDAKDLIDRAFQRVVRERRGPLQ
jgi:hypothetical protein